jgi:uncharacterized membrane protein YhaH (DUF805 family)
MAIQSGKTVWIATGYLLKGNAVMKTVRYKIVFDGLTALDIPEETVKADLARLFKCDLSRIAPLFDGRPHTLKRGLDKAQADQYVQSLRKVGAMVRMEREQVQAAAASQPIALNLVEEPELERRGTARQAETMLPASGSGNSASEGSPTVAEAREFKQAMAQQTPSNDREAEAEALFQKGVAFTQQGKADAAMTAFGEVDRRFSKDDTPEVRMWVALALFNKGMLLNQQDNPAAVMVAFDEIERRFGRDDSSIVREVVAKAREFKQARFGKARQNIYRSPTQEVARDQAAYCRLPIVSTNGRLGRMRFMAWNMVLALSLVLAIFPMFLLSTMLKAIFLVMVLIVWLGISLTFIVRRLHDINISGWWVLLVIVLMGVISYKMQQSPSVNLMIIFLLVQFLFWAFLCIKPGDEGMNDYDYPPPPNSTAVLFLAGLFIFFSAIYSIGTMTQLKKVGAMLPVQNAARNDMNVEAQIQEFERQLEQQIAKDPNLQRQMREHPEETRRKIEEVKARMRQELEKQNRNRKE